MACVGDLTSVLLETICPPRSSCCGVARQSRLTPGGPGGRLSLSLYQWSYVNLFSDRTKTDTTNKLEKRNKRNIFTETTYYNCSYAYSQFLYPPAMWSQATLPVSPTKDSPLTAEITIHSYKVRTVHSFKNGSLFPREWRPTKVRMDGRSWPKDIIHMKVLKRQWSDVIGMF